MVMVSAWTALIAPIANRASAAVTGKPNRA
jgi:hypothetical protein